LGLKLKRAKTVKKLSNHSKGDLFNILATISQGVASPQIHSKLSQK
jgi:hypothetical protein